jgi:membrane protease YdiL (CAAX protease family)
MQGEGAVLTPAEREGLPYHQVLRGAWPGWWRYLAGVVLLGVTLIVVWPLVLTAPFSLYFALDGQNVSTAVQTMLDLKHPTPLGLAYLNLVLASAIPITWFIVRFIHGLRPRWLASVAPRIRWKFLLVCLGLAVVALAATLAVSAVVPGQGDSGDVSGKMNDLTKTTLEFAVVVLLLTPLQAAGEEYAFRGYLTQAFGGLFRHPAIAVAVSATLFALAHGGQDAPIFFDRFAFGVVAGTLVIVTGGLEAGIAMHVLNNFLAFGAALLFGDMGSSLNPSGGTWWSIPVTLTQSLVYLGLAWYVSRAMGLQTRTDPAVLGRPILERPSARV